MVFQRRTISPVAPHSSVSLPCEVRSMSPYRMRAPETWLAPVSSVPRLVTWTSGARCDLDLSAWVPLGWSHAPWRCPSFEASACQCMPPKVGSALMT